MGYNWLLTMQNRQETVVPISFPNAVVTCEIILCQNISAFVDVRLK